MAERLAKNLKDEYLSCRICLDQYKDPRRLPCDHIFCKDCLINHVTQTFTTRHFRNYVTCPLCRTEFEGQSQDSDQFIPNDWVCSLPSDSLVVSLLQTLQLHEKELPDKYKYVYRCTTHGGKVREAFCLTHAQMVCWECAAKDHNSCKVESTDKALPHVQPKVEKLQERVAYHLTCAQELSKSDRDFDDKKSKTLHNLERLQDQFEKIKTSVDSQFKLIRSDIEKCNSIHLKQRREFYSLVASLLEQKCILEGCLADGDATDILCAYDVISKAVSDASKLMNKYKTSPDEINLSLVIDPLFEDFVSKYSSIGFVEPGPISGAEGMEATKTPTKSVPSSIAHILNRTNRQSNEIDNSRCVKSFHHMHDINAVLEKEESCFINGMVSFDGTMVYVLDRENEKIKQFDMAGKLVDVLPLSGPPHDITCLQPNYELGITQPDEKLIAILSGNGLAHRRYIQTVIPYNGICQVNYSTIALSSWSTLSVDIMTTHGDLLYHISKDAHDLKCDLPNILCKLSNERIVLTELGCTIMCIKSSHHPPENAIVQWTYTAPERIYGVCADENDLIYACVRDRNEVRLIYDDGYLCKAAVLTEKDGINKPVCVYYCNGNLFVADEKTIKVFKVVT